MKGSLLVCIAYHHSPERIKYLDKVVDNFINNYGIKVDIIVDTNIYDWDTGSKWECYTKVLTRQLFPTIRIVSHENLEHPFHLTYCHRRHIKDNIDNYDYVAYFEDDMLLPFENYISYLETFKLLWPKYVPSFIRVEEKDGQQYVSDVPARQNINDLGIIEIEGRYFVALPFPINYCALWVMPQKELKETMKYDFVRVSDGREFAAMYTGWELQKPALIEVRKTDTGYEVSPQCLSYHLPNNYALSEGSPNGKILLSELFL